MSVLESRIAYYNTKLKYYLDCFEVNKKYSQNFENIRILSKNHLKSALNYYVLIKKHTKEQTSVESST